MRASFACSLARSRDGSIRRAGKSSLVRQFIENEFQESYYPTIESSHTKTVKHNGTEYQLSIIDTAGQVCLRARPPECRC